MYKHQLVEFKKYEGRIHYWAIKKVIYENDMPVRLEHPDDITKEIHTEAKNNPRLYAHQHDF
jgi:hypothetical protein